MVTCESFYIYKLTIDDITDERISHKSIASEFFDVEPRHNREIQIWKREEDERSSERKVRRKEGVQINTLGRTSTNYKDSCKQKRQHYRDIGYRCENYLRVEPTY